MAGRIPQPFIDDLIDRSDIVELISSRVSLKKSGKNYSACCPFHDEKTPSFTVSPQKQFYYCFGCGAGGNVIGFLMEHDHMDFLTAVETLAKSAGLEIPHEQTSPEIEARQRRRLDIYSELETAANFYRQQLRQHPAAIDYLKSRGLTGEIAKQFALGYAPDQWDSLIKLCGDNQQATQLMIDGGMLIEREHQDGRSQSNNSNYYDRFRDRVMFPIRDQRGRIIAFGGRVLGEQKPKYLNSPETSVFHKSRELYGLYEALQKRQRPQQLIVVEGYMDVVALAQFGIQNAVATLGTSVGTAHMDKIFRQVSQLVFCFDGDEAGRRAAQRALDACLPSMIDGRQVSFLFLPEGQDPDSIVRAEGAAGFNQRVAEAKTLSDFIFDLAATDLDLSKSDQKALFAHRALPYLSQLPKGLLQSVLMQQLADQTGIDKQQLLNITPPKPVAKTTQPITPAPLEQDRRESDIAESPVAPEKTLSKNFKRLLAFILQSPQLAMNEKLSDSLLKREDHFQLVHNIRALVTKNPNTEFIHLHGYWLGQAPEIVKQLNQIYGATLLKEIPAENLEAEFNETIEHLTKSQTRAAIQQRIREIAAVPYEQLTTELRDEQKKLHAELKIH